MVESAAMLVIDDDQQRPRPHRRVPHRVVDGRDQLFAIEQIVRRVLVVRHLVREVRREIARLDKTVVRQPADPAMPLEFGLELAEMRRNFRPEIEQRRGLRDIVEVDFPTVAVSSQAPENRRHHARPLIRETAQRVVDIAAGGAAMREITVRPGLARGRGVPAVRDAEFTGQPADDGHLRGQEIVHDPAGSSGAQGQGWRT